MESNIESEDKVNIYKNTWNVSLKILHSSSSVSSRTNDKNTVSSYLIYFRTSEVLARVEGDDQRDGSDDV